MTDLSEYAAIGFPESKEGAFVVFAQDVRREHVEWIIEGRVPAGMVTLLAGDPGLGKSMLTIGYGAQVAAEGGTVLFLTAEDSITATCKPRLEAVRADLSRVGWAMLRRDGIEEGLILPTHLDELDRLVRVHEARLVVVDPLTAHLSEMVNSWRDQSVRMALAPLHHLAQRHGCAVLAVLHLNKMRSGTALHRIGGSIGIPAAARSALLLARDPDDADGEQGKRRVLAHFKCNVGPEQPSLLYELEPILLPAVDGEPETTTARMRLIGECAHSSADLLNSLTSEEDRSERDEAKAFLLEELGEAPLPASEVVKAAKAAGISQRTLERAKADLGVKSQKSGFGRGWEWHLPDSHEGRQDDWQPSEDGLGGGLPENPHGSGVSGAQNGPASPEERQSELLADFGAVRPVSSPGDAGFIEFLDEALAGGHINELERRERRLTHFNIVRAGA